MGMYCAIVVSQGERLCERRDQTTIRKFIARKQPLSQRDAGARHR